MERSYHVVSRNKRIAAGTLEAFCQPHGQVLLPLLEWVEQARLAVDTVTEQVRQQTRERILDPNGGQGRLGPNSHGAGDGRLQRTRQ